jgi:hypothetical protein
MIGRCTDSFISPLSLAGRLDSDDLADLRRSGLSDDMIAEMGCFSAEASEIEKLTGVKVASFGYAIPYAVIPDQTGSQYVRFRLRAPSGDMRYVSGRGDDPQVYVPPGLAQLPVSDLLVITEGEKKSAKASRRGFTAFGFRVSGAHSTRVLAPSRSRGAMYLCSQHMYFCWEHMYFCSVAALQVGS